MEDSIEAQSKISRNVIEINAIQESRNKMIRTRSEIAKLVELPLLSACEHFWDLNIRTLSTSANKKDVGGNGYINIDYDSLSDENKIIAQENGEIYKNAEETGISFNIPITDTTTVDQIKDAADRISNSFKKQKATWIPSYSIQEIREIYGFDQNDDKQGPEVFTQEGLFYDSESGKFYLSEEHFKKTKDTT